MSTEEMSGGWSEEQLVTPAVKEICMKVRSEIENKTGANFKVYNPLSFSHEVLETGTKYVVKVVVSVDMCFHAKIFAALACNGGGLDVQYVQYPKSLSDPLVVLPHPTTFRTFCVIL